MKLSIIIVSYNTAKLTLQTVKSIYHCLPKNSPLTHQFEILVIDNHSHDQTLAWLAKLQQKNLILLPQQDNLGFGKANNLGFQHAQGEYLLFLNSDTIVHKGSIEKMLNYYQAQEEKSPSLGLLAAQLLNQDGTFQPQGGDTPTLTSIFNTMFFLDDLPFLAKFLPAVQHTGRNFKPKSILQHEFIPKSWVGGTAVLVKKSILKKYGPWDEHIFMYGEDQELAHRLSQHQYYHGILTQAHITHLGSASSSSSNAIHGELKGYFYFFRKFYPSWKKFPLKLILISGVLLRCFIFSWLKKDSARALAYKQALSMIIKQ